MMTMPCTPPVQSRALVLQDLRHRHAEREGGEREIEAFEPQRRQAEQEAGARRQTAPATGIVAQYGTPALSIRIAAL